MGATDSYRGSLEEGFGEQFLLFFFIIKKQFLMNFFKIIFKNSFKIVENEHSIFFCMYFL